MSISGIPVVFEDGDVIIREGDAAADLYVVVSGGVDVVKESGDTRTVIEHIAAGGFFGEVALFSPGPRAATVVATGRTECEVIDLPTFKAYVGDPLIWAICARMAERLQRVSADTSIDSNLTEKE